MSYQLRMLEQGDRLGRKMENGKKDGVCVQGRRVPITKSEFQSLCDLHDEGTFMSQCGRWHNMEKMCVEIPNRGSDLFDEIK